MQRQRAMQFARARMMDAVPTADVVVTNPTHFSVALRYAADALAPVVVAKGQDLVALRIREIAREHGVLVVPDPPLARALHGTVEIGQMIPEELFQAVAELLAYVYRVAGGRRREHERRCMKTSAGRHADLVAAGAVVLVVVMMIVPLPPFLLDLVITLNISAALMIVIATLYVPRALDFSAFPSLLLLTTLFRLAINVSVTRLILLARRRRPRRRRVRQLRRRRQRRRRPDHLPDPRRDPVRGHHERRRPRRRGRRALHARRDARQADGDRRRPQRRPDHRRGGAQAPRRDLRRRPTSTARWTAPRSSSRATPSRASSSR